MSIFVDRAGDYMSSMSDLWGYRLDIARVFHPEPVFKSRTPFDGNVIFMPDGKRFIYQHLTYQFDRETTLGIFDTPMQIVRYDPYSDKRTILASDPAYHYRLCQFDGSQSCPLQWFGDWIQVQRLPFKPFTSISYWVNIDQSCLFEGQQCEVAPESMALNTYSGELRPWDPVSLPLAYPTPTPTPGPTGRPVYTDPDGRFAFYVGADGKSLWMAPRQGPAILWVTDGEGFIYLR